MKKKKKPSEEKNCEEKNLIKKFCKKKKPFEKKVGKMAPLKKKETLLKENHPFWEKPLFEEKTFF